MKITKEHIAATIYDMISAGKKVPDTKGLDGSSQEPAEIMKRTVALWWSVFGDYGYSVERWNRATKIALTLTGVGTLNVNHVTPALMDEALKQEEKIRLQEQASKAQSDKANEGKPRFADDTYQSKAAHYLWLWTARKLAGHSTIVNNLPSDKAVFEYANRLGVECEFPKGENTIAGYNYRIIQTFLADAHFCKNKCIPSRCYMGKIQPRLKVENGMFVFGEGSCGK